MGLKTWLGLKKAKSPSEQPSIPEIRAITNLNGYRIIDEGGIAPTFPIDVVYTWVDSSDPAFREELAAHLPPESPSTLTGPARFRSHDELRYSLRSLESYAPWINRIYIVTNGQRPTWLTDHPKITLVSHKEILEPEYLPTFNSHVIGSALHRIPGLSEHYVYFNDDIILLRPIEPTELFTANGLAYGFAGNIALPEGLPVPGETATNWAAKNARNLVFRQWGRAYARRFAHVCHPQIKSVAEECEQRFATEYSAFRGNKFRAMNDLLVCSYLHPVAGYLSGKAIFTRTVWWYVMVHRPDAEQLYGSILMDRDSPNARMVACLNDHPGFKTALPDYDERMLSFLNAYFPLSSSFERSDQ